ncbi:LytTR family transcriptional regulator DNA-binding domain-containing protein [Polaribacter sp. R77954]|uniref:LytTR family transcriptional regulator DNA-binding domain-containing protein n=1 Tax=Polaribacter sp. R77954 TaxID=3093870 RepID=UPI0037C8E32B
MLLEFKNWINSPYFFISSNKLNLLISFGTGGFIFLFLYVFQPFELEKLQNNLLLYTAGFGVITFSIQCIFFIILPYLFRDFFNSDYWTVGKNIIFFLTFISTITITNWFYNSLVQNSSTIALLSLQSFIFYTFSIAIIPIAIFTYLSEKFYRNKRENISDEIMKTKVVYETIEQNKNVTLYAQNTKDSITFNLSKLVYISSQSNYASIFLTAKTGLKECIIRNTLTALEVQLKDYTTIKRCHKSYIIHTTFMDSISGNARGYYLKSKLVSINIPISRRFKKSQIVNFIK